MINKRDALTPLLKSTAAVAGSGAAGASPPRRKLAEDAAIRAARAQRCGRCARSDGVPRVATRTADERARRHCP